MSYIPVVWVKNISHTCLVRGLGPFGRVVGLICNGDLFLALVARRRCCNPGDAFGHEMGGHCVLDHVLFFRRPNKNSTAK